MPRFSPRLVSFRVSAGALSLTLGVSIVATAILSAMILAAYYYKLEQVTYQRHLDVQRLLSSGIAIALADKSMALNESQAIQLFEDIEDSIIVSRQKWGLWDIYKVMASRGDYRLERSFSKGLTRSEAGTSALYIPDERRPISVVGKTTIRGTAYLPYSGIQSAYIDRIGYLNDSLMYGEQKQSGDTMPRINIETYEVIAELIEGKSDLQTDPYRELFPVRWSFNEDSVLAFKARAFDIVDTLSGKIWIHADDRIFVSREAVLDQVILSAAVVEIDTGFVGNIQVFASDTILVRPRVTLEYPSSLVVINEKPPAHILLTSESAVHGTILMSGDSSDYYQRVVTLNDNSTFNGMLFCDGLLEVSGSIYGHTSTRKFLVNTLSAVYENYLYNATLDGDSLNASYLAPRLWYYGDTYEVLQWLN